MTRFTTAPRGDVLDMPVDVVTYAEATAAIAEAARAARPGYVCVANVHMVMVAWDDPGFQDIVRSASLVVPDGMPLVWTLRLQGFRSATRVRGPSLVLHLAEHAARQGIPLGLYGGSPQALEGFRTTLMQRYPQLEVAAAMSPPFGDRSVEEVEADVEALRRSGARIILVGLGCPKQERWMARHTEGLPAVLVGVGAAFDIHGGQVPEAPGWMQSAGLEWLFRLALEPRRLWRRYAIQNVRFLVYLIGRIVSGRVRP